MLARRALDDHNADMTIQDLLFEAGHCKQSSWWEKYRRNNQQSCRKARIPSLKAEKQKCSNDWKFLVRFYLNRQAGHSSQSHGPFVLEKLQQMSR